MAPTKMVRIAGRSYMRVVLFQEKLSITFKEWDGFGYDIQK